jgi:hypothetical protein
MDANQNAIVVIGDSISTFPPTSGVLKGYKTAHFRGAEQGTTAVAGD